MFYKNIYNDEPSYFFSTIKPLYCETKNSLEALIRLLSSEDKSIRDKINNIVRDLENILKTDQQNIPLSILNLLDRKRRLEPDMRKLLLKINEIYCIFRERTVNSRIYNMHKSNERLNILRDDALQFLLAVSPLIFKK